MAPKGLSATKAGSELRSSIAVRRAGQEHEQVPRLIEADLVAHCGPALVGEFARTLTATDVFTGWTENVAIRNTAYEWILAAMETVAERLPFPLTGLDTDNGGELINQAHVGWATARDIYFTRARPYKSNDNAHVEHIQLQLVSLAADKTQAMRQAPTRAKIREARTAVSRAS